MRQIADLVLGDDFDHLHCRAESEWRVPGEQLFVWALVPGEATIYLAGQRLRVVGATKAHKGSLLTVKPTGI